MGRAAIAGLALAGFAVSVLVYLPTLGFSWVYLAVSEATTNGAVERLDALASLDLKTAGLRMGYADLLLHAGRRDEGLAQLRQALALAARSRPSSAQLQAIHERIEAATSGVRP